MKRAWTILGGICVSIIAIFAITGYVWFSIGLWSNHWLTWFLATYTMAVGMAIGTVVFALKLAAIIDPRIPTNKIVDLIQNTLGTTGEFPKLPVTK